jgi:hypothetical protein
MTDSAYHDGSKRDNCYFCGAFGNLEEHHVIPQRFDGPDAEENIVELCKSCHKKIERLYDSAFFEWFGIEDESGKRTFHRSCVLADCAELTEVVLRAPVTGSKNHFCLNHAFKRVRKDRVDFWLNSSIVHNYRFTQEGISKLDQSRRRALFDPDANNFLGVSYEDIQTAKLENVTPLTEDGDPVTEVMILREFATDMSDTAKKALR